MWRPCVRHRTFVLQVIISPFPCRFTGGMPQYHNTFRRLKQATIHKMPALRTSSIARVRCYMRRRTHGCFTSNIGAKPECKFYKFLRALDRSSRCSESRDPNESLLSKLGKKFAPIGIWKTGNWASSWDLRFKSFELKDLRTGKIYGAHRKGLACRPPYGHDTRPGHR